MTKINGEIIVIGVKFSGNTDKMISEVLPDSPVSELVGAGQCGKGEFFCSEAKVV